MQNLSSSVVVSSHGHEYGVKHFFIPSTQTLGSAIESALDLPSNDLKLLVFLGSVYLNHRRLDSATQTDLVVEVGSLIRIHTKPRRYKIDFDWMSRIVFQNDDFLILDKPSGIPSHPSVDNCIENSLTQMSKSLGKNLFISHRLDTLTQGLIVYGKHSAFVSAFNHLINEHRVAKKYIALTEMGPVLARKLIHYMKPDPRAPKKIDHVAHDKWARCELEILEQRKYETKYWLFKLNLLTGRTHQIRSQLAFEQCPILGDKMYGAKEPYLHYETPAIALKAYEIEFTYNQQTHLFRLSEDFSKSIQS